MRYRTADIAAFITEAFDRARRRGKRGLAAGRVVDRAIRRRFPKLTVVQYAAALDMLDEPAPCHAGGHEAS
jgi:hypothetical protein